MSNPKVSIIVPVYNVESYLDRCLKSLINQTFKDIEIIIINDGSTDNCKSILRNYKKKDNRIKVIDKLNEGISMARNEGIDLANGDYIMFVDSDDWINETMIEKMYNQTKDDTDLVICMYNRVYDNKFIPRVLNDMPYLKHYKDDIFNDEIYRRLVGPIGKELKNPQYLDSLSPVWAKLYKTSKIKENKVYFISTNEILGEDTLFNITLFNYIKNCTFINEPLYNYWKGNETSITSKYRDNLKDKSDNLYYYIKDVLIKSKKDKIFYEALDNRRCLSILGLGINICSKSNKTSVVDKIKSIKEILRDKNITKCLSNLQLDNFSLHWKLFYFFCKHKIAIPIYGMIKCIDLIRKYV